MSSRQHRFRKSKHRTLAKQAEASQGSKQLEQQKSEEEVYKERLEISLYRVTDELRGNGVEQFGEDDLIIVPYPSQIKKMAPKKRDKIFKYAIKFVEENGLQYKYPETMGLKNLLLTEETRLTTERLRAAQVNATKIETVRPQRAPETAGQRIRRNMNKRAFLDNSQTNSVPFPTSSVDNSMTSEENAINKLARDIAVDKDPTGELARVCGGATITYMKLLETAYKAQSKEEIAQTIAELTYDTWDVEKQERAMKALTRIWEVSQEWTEESKETQETLNQNAQGSLIPTDLSLDAYDKSQSGINPKELEEKADSSDDIVTGQQLEPDDNKEQTQLAVTADRAPRNQLYEETVQALEPTGELKKIADAWDNSYSLVYGDGYQGGNPVLGTAGASEQFVKDVRNGMDHVAQFTMDEGQRKIDEAVRLAREGAPDHQYGPLYNQGKAMMAEGQDMMREFEKMQHSNLPSVQKAKEQVAQTVQNKFQEVLEDPNKALNALEQFGEVIKDPKGAVMKTGEMVADEMKRRTEDYALGKLPKDAPGVFDDMKGVLSSAVEDRKEGGHSQGAGGTGEINDYFERLRQAGGRIQGGVLSRARGARPDVGGQRQMGTSGTSTSSYFPQSDNSLPKDDDELRKYTGSLKIARKPVPKISRKKAHNQVYAVQRGIAEYNAYKTVFNSSFR